MSDVRELLGALMAWIAGIASFILSASLAFHLGGIILAAGKATAGYFSIMLAVSGIITIFGGAFIAIFLSALIGCIIYGLITEDWYLFS